MDTSSNSLLKMNSEERYYFYRLNNPLYTKNGLKSAPPVGETVSVSAPVFEEPSAPESPHIKASALNPRGVVLEDKSESVDSLQKRKSLLSAIMAAFGVTLVLAAGVIVWLMVSGDSGRQIHSSNASFSVRAGESVPSFKGYILDPEGLGTSLSSVDFYGKRVVLLAWRGSQSSSLEYLRSLTQLQSQYGSRNESSLVFVGLSLDEKKGTAVNGVLDTNSFEWSHIYDWDDRNASSSRPSVLLGVVETPAIYVFDPVQRLEYRGFEPSDLSLFLAEKY